MSILIYGMKKGKFCHQFSNFTIPPSMKIHKNEVKFKNWICQNFFPENKMDVNLQYKSKGGKSLTLKTLPQQMFRIVTFHVDHTVSSIDIFVYAELQRSACVSVERKIQQSNLFEHAIALFYLIIIHDFHGHTHLLHICSFLNIYIRHS